MVYVYDAFTYGVYTYGAYGVYKYGVCIFDNDIEYFIYHIMI